LQIAQVVHLVISAGRVLPENPVPVNVSINQKPYAIAAVNGELFHAVLTRYLRLMANSVLPPGVMNAYGQ
jgi:bisphosphoglycerate-independent phosphoglycerate mutase (AlkP superfamily)